MGTYRLGEDKNSRQQELQTFRCAILNYDMTLIDTAEMYADGISEQFVGEAIKGFDRTKLFIVDKILPHNASCGRYYESCMRSLERLGTDYIDLYLLHWRGGVDLQDMVSNMQSLVDKGLIRHWGVSNFDTGDMRELFACEGGSECFCNQVLYNLATRGPEYSLIPWCRHNGVLVMAYSPLCQSARERMAVICDEGVAHTANKQGKTCESLMLSFVIRSSDIITVFKTSSEQHLTHNMQNVFGGISDEDLHALSQRFSPPDRKTPLEKI
jgi:diketogulonate reductase-like aldo/keto reductase